MSPEILIKNIAFLKKECLRYQNDKIITGDEIHFFTIEIDRFINKIEAASFTKEIKKIIYTIDFNLDEENHNKPKYRWLNFLGGFHGSEIRNQMNLKNRFDRLYNDLDTALYQIKTIL